MRFPREKRRRAFQAEAQRAAGPARSFSLPFLSSFLSPSPCSPSLPYFYANKLLTKYVEHIYAKAKVLVTQLCPTLWDPKDCDPSGFSVHGISQTRILEWVAILSLQGIFPTQGWNPSLPHCRQILYHLSHQPSPVSNT